MFNEGLGEAVGGVVEESDGECAVRSKHADRKQEATSAHVGRGDDFPLAAVPVLFQRLSVAARVEAIADRPHGGRSRAGHAVQHVWSGSRVWNRYEVPAL